MGASTGERLGATGCKPDAAGGDEARRRFATARPRADGIFLPCSEETRAGARVTSGLWACVSALPAPTITRAIPPACRREVSAASVTADREEAIVEGPVWATAGATHFVPSFTALTDAFYSARIELSARIGGAWSPWIAGVGLGPASFPPLASAPPLSVDVDVIRSALPVEAVRVRARLRAEAVSALVVAPSLLTLSAAREAAPSRAPEAARRPVRLAVPALSQMECEPAIARRICSPTCVAMVLGFWGRAVTPAAIAAEVFHPATDLYGIWPAAVRAAGRRGVAGYLLRFPDWVSAAWCLEQGLPVIASVRYAAGAVRGAAMAETTGHLVVLTGLDGDDVLVNDPAAATAATVARRYRAADVAHAWLDGTGVGYVLFPPRR